MGPVGESGSPVRRVVICDDHRVFGQALSAVLQANGYEVVACTSDPGSGVAAVARHQPDVYVVDLHFPGGPSLETFDSVRADSPDTRIVVLSGSGDPMASTHSQRAGAGGFVAKDRPIDEILTAIGDVAEGRPIFHESDRRSPDPSSALDRPNRGVATCLTSRERDVLDRLVQGEDTVTIARHMGITYSTARTHIQSLITKLGVHSRLEAVALVTANQRL
jgi:two-component system, NarL family, nitrate/nitrite response regulator NarL